MDTLHKVEDNLIFLTVALTVIVLPLVWLTSAFDVFGAVKYFFLILLAALSLGTQAWQAVRSGKLRLPGGRVGLVLAAFLLWLLLSAVFSPTPAISFFGLRKRLLGFVTYAAAAILLAGAARVSWDKTKLRYVYYATSITVILTSLIGFAQWSGSTFPFDLKALFGSAAYSTFGNPAYFGLFLAMTLPLPLHLLLEGRGTGDKLIGALALATGVGGLAAAASSGAVVGAIGSTGAYLILRYLSGNEDKTRAAKIAAACLLSAVCVGSVYAATQERTAIGQRLWIWSAGTKTAAAHPFIGVGLENLKAGLEEIGPTPEKGADGVQYEDAHNIWINLAATAGLPAALLAVVFFASVVSEVARAPRESGFAGRAAPVFAAACTGYLAAAQFNPEDIGSLPLLWTFAGIAIGLSRKTHLDLRLKPQTKPVAILLVGALAVASSGFAYKSLTAEIDLLNATTARTLSGSRAAFKAAQNARPWQPDYYTLEIYQLIPYVGSLTTPTGRELTAAAQEAVKRNQKDTAAWLAYADLYRAVALRQNDPALHKVALDIAFRVLSIDKYNARAVRLAAMTYKDLNESDLSLRWIRRFERFFADDADLVNLKYDLLNKAGAAKPDKL